MVAVFTITSLVKFLQPKSERSIENIPFHLIIHLTFSKTTFVLNHLKTTMFNPYNFIIKWKFIGLTIFFLIFFFSFNGYSNTKVSFSARQIDDLLTKAWEYRSNNLDSMKWYFSEALEWSRNVGYPQGEGKALNTEGFYYYILGKHDLAIEVLKKAEKIQQFLPNKKELAQTTNFLGLVHWARGELDKALVYQLEFLKHGHRVKNRIMLADAYLNIGAIYKSCREFALAEEYLLKGLEVHKSLENKEGVGYCLHHLAGVHYQLKKYEKALEYFQKAITVWETSKDKRGMGYSYAELSTLVLELEQDNTLEVLEKSYQLIQEFEQGAVLAGILHNLGYFYYKKEDWKKAEDFFLQSLNIAKNHNVNNIIVDNAAKLAAISEYKNNYKMANEFLRLQLIHQDEMDAKNRKETTDWLVTKNELAQEKIENENLKLRELQNKKLLKTQRIVGGCLFLLVLLTGLFARYFYLNHRKGKRLNRQLTALNLAIQEKNEAIEKQSLQLQTVNQELENFTAIASHDMKEPLRTVTSFGMLLKRRLRGQNDMMEYLDFIIDAGQRMTALLENLLDYARSGGQTQEVEIVHLNDVFLVVQNNLMIKVQESGAQIKVNNDLPNVLANKEPLIQLFQNLIGNGIKFQPKDQQPVIHIHTKEEEEWTEIAISDNGIGISKENIAKVFAPFHRLHNRRDYEGSGLGLATCRKIVERYGGTISATSELGTGTTFVIRLKKAINELAILD